MDPITWGLFLIAIAAAAYGITKLVILTATWLKTKLKKILSGKKEVVGINGDKLKSILADIAEETEAISVDDLDMLLFGIDEKGEIKDIEFVEAEEGLDSAAAAFMDRNNNIIRICS
ncbi:MAG: hypothetical protein Q4C58_07250 [Eubacteriales bacterium]|nr:hypothetical protein [Eubacteriales bacterium]